MQMGFKNKIYKLGFEDCFNLSSHISVNLKPIVPKLCETIIFDYNYIWSVSCETARFNNYGQWKVLRFLFLFCFLSTLQLLISRLRLWQAIRDITYCGNKKLKLYYGNWKSHNALPQLYGRYGLLELYFCSTHYRNLIFDRLIPQRVMDISQRVVLFYNALPQYVMATMACDSAKSTRRMVSGELLIDKKQIREKKSSAFLLTLGSLVNSTTEPKNKVKIGDRFQNSSEKNIRYISFREVFFMKIPLIAGGHQYIYNAEIICKILFSYSHSMD